MLLLDVNVLVYAHREDAPEHALYRTWLEELANGYEPFAVPDLSFSGFIRIVTHPNVFSPPSKLEEAFGFVEALRGRPNCVAVRPGERHWEIFAELCQSANAKGNLVPDAYLAAMAIETGSEWITTDGDYGRFPKLRWRHPFR